MSPGFTYLVYLVIGPKVISFYYFSMTQITEMVPNNQVLIYLELIPTNLIILFSYLLKFMFLHRKLL